MSQNDQILINYKGKKIPVSVSGLLEAYRHALSTNCNYVFYPIYGKKRIKILTLPREQVKELLIKSEKVEPSELEKIPPPPQSQIVLNEEVLNKFKKKPTEEIKEDVDVFPRDTVVCKPKIKEENNVNEDISTDYSPSFIDRVRQRVKTVFEPLFSESTYNETDYNTKYKPRLNLTRKTIYKCRNYYSFDENYAYEPRYTQIEEEFFEPKDKEVLSYNPQTIQESYPTFTYATFGLPDTYIDQYAPEESVKIKPVTEFELSAKPKPLIVSKAHLILLNKLINEVL